MHVCLVSPAGITDRKKWGGVHTHTERLALTLSHIGVQVTCIAPSDVRAGTRLAENAVVEPVSARLGWRVDKEWRDNVEWAFRAVRNRLPVDCIFSEGHFAYGLREAAGVMNIPLVSFVHNFSVIHFYNNSRDVSSFRSLCGFIARTVPIIFGRMLRYEIPFYRRSRYVVSGSAFNGVYLKRLYGIRPSQLRVIHNWIDTDAFAPDDSARHRVRGELGFAEDTQIFLVVAALSRIKGVQVAIKAFGEVLKHFPRSRLVIAGEGKDRPWFESLAGEMQLEKKVVFLGHQTREALRGIYNAADIFLMPSLISEVLPYTLLEAMSSGLPVIATGLGGNAELAAGAGVLVKVNSIASLATAMRALASDRERRRCLAEAARRRVATCFSEDVGRQQIAALVDELRDCCAMK
jgi:glycosyltransferase involved in cell wall biosynthesis